MTLPSSIRRVGIVFSGGPAPAANAVISAAAISFLAEGIEVYGFFHGYSNLAVYDAQTNPLIEDTHYRRFTDRDVRGKLNSRGILIGTARVNPGMGIYCPEDLGDSERTAGLRRVYDGLISLGIDGLISIGGDGTLTTANFLYMYQALMSDDKPRVRIVHLPKTIDNDYRGIDFTFGYFTAVDVMSRELLNLRADCQATSSYFIVETMGRKAGWLTYGVGITGEANRIIGVEDMHAYFDAFDEVDAQTGERTSVQKLSLDRLAHSVVDLIISREAQNKHYGTIVVAEGLAEHLPAAFTQQAGRDGHGNVVLGKVRIGGLLAQAVSDEYLSRTSKKKKITPIQLGYESRSAPPHAFDVMLGSQLGCGAYRALVEEQLDGHMVSVSGQLDLNFVPFSELVDPKNLLTEVRYITRGSDFHRLARFMETRSENREEWELGQRREELR